MSAQASSPFQKLVAVLWERLGLGLPRFSEPDRVRLRVETVGLDLIDNGRGALDIEGVAGRLSSDPALRANQVGRILRTNMGLLVGNDAGAFLRPALDGEVALAIRSSAIIRSTHPDRLVKKIEDVVRLVEYYAGELKSANITATSSSRPAAQAFEAAMIFRP